VRKQAGARHCSALFRRDRLQPSFQGDARSELVRSPCVSTQTEIAIPTRKPAAAKKPRTAAVKRAPKKKTEQPALLKHILKSLDDDKAEDVVTIDLEGRSSLADALVIATGRSTRHVASMAEHIARHLKEEGYGTRPVNGAAQGDWVLVDAGDVIVHLFRAEVRDYYDLEGMWSVEEPKRKAAR
jgi:ribosome-associated protein